MLVHRFYENIRIKSRDEKVYTVSNHWIQRAIIIAQELELQELIIISGYLINQL